MITFSELALLDGVLNKTIVKDFPVEHIFTDSRKPIVYHSSLFLAIPGKIHDGHDYIPELYKSGIRLFIISKGLKMFSGDYPDAGFIQVNNTISFLQEIASYKRSQYNLMVIGITGSNGKTIVKEWLSKMLSANRSVLKSPASYNSQIGVPLSVWPIDTFHETGVFEAGISQKNEMDNLQKVIRPDVGIFTNIGPAHDEGFSSRKEKIFEKLKLFSNAGSLIICSDHSAILDAVKKNIPGINLLSWGNNADDFLEILSISKQENTTIITIKDDNEPLFYHVPFTDDASIENVMHCITCLKFLEWSDENILAEIQKLDEIPMRLEIKKGINDCFIIDDSYNNDLTGLSIALSFQANQNQKVKKTLILSDILQSGMQLQELYSQVANLISRYHLNKVFAIGKDIAILKELYPGELEIYPSTSAFLDSVNPNSFKNEIILLKGARPFRFESVVNVIQEKIHGTILEINLDHVSQNLNVFRNMLPLNTKIMIMVKALAYGSGSLEIANLMQYHRVDYLGVAYADEGVFLRTNGINTPIMVMNPSKETFESLVRFRLEPEIYSFRILNKLIDYLRENKKHIGIHLKMDTGMHRLGFNVYELDELAEILSKTPELEVISIFSHLAGADSAGHDQFTHDQAALFKSTTKKLCDTLNIQPIKHICNSAGMVRFPQYHMDMVRLGIGLYGFDIGLQKLSSLKTISTLKTEVSQIKYLDQGHTIGYNRAGKAGQKTKIATIAIGYADGFSRAFSNGKAEILVNGKMAPVIGNVCMDMTMIDVTGIDVNEGDTAIIFSNKAPITRLSDAIGTIPYEILTSVSDRVKRVFYSS